LAPGLKVELRVGLKVELMMRLGPKGAIEGGGPERRAPGLRPGGESEE
jgi:hypothetical protein